MTNLRPERTWFVHEGNVATPFEHDQPSVPDPPREFLGTSQPGVSGAIGFFIS
jgi:hypothetical protein